MDNELTRKLQEWLAEPEHMTVEDVTNGALMLLKLNRNRILFNNIMRNPTRYVRKIEYELGKFLKIRLDGLTMQEVAAMDKEVTPLVKNAVKAEQNEGSEDAGLSSHNGKRADHDSLPDSIKAIWSANAGRWKKIKELYNTLLTLKMPCDRYEYLKQMKEQWYAYKRDFALYDGYTADSANDTASTDGLRQMASFNDIGNSRSYLSKMVKDDKLLNMKKASLADDADEKAISSYNTALANTQKRVQLLIDSGEEIGDDLKAKLTDAGVVFPSEQPSETVDSTDDNNIEDEQGQEG